MPRPVAMLARWNPEGFGGFDLMDVRVVDGSISADMLRVFTLLPVCRRYPDAMGYSKQFEAIFCAWRPGPRASMIAREGAMTVRENVHQLVDTLPEDRLDDALDYLADLGDTEETLSAATEAVIEPGLVDIRNRRTISLEEYCRTRGL